MLVKKMLVKSVCFLLGCECYRCVVNVKVLKNIFSIQRTIGYKFENPVLVQIQWHTCDSMKTPSKGRHGITFDWFRTI
jgi:hypothetical protein